MRLDRYHNRQAPCARCGDEGAEYCWLCHHFMCDMCLHIDYENHREEAKRYVRDKADHYSS